MLYNKDDLCAAIQDFFKFGRFFELNKTFITLIPEIPQADKLKDLKHISLCNFIYNVISKLLSNIFQIIMPHIISKSQSTFVKGRHIGDNNVLAHEMIRKIFLQSQVGTFV